MYKNISATLDNNVKDQITQRIREIESMLPFVINLSPTERRSIPKMGHAALKFVESAMVYSEKNPTIVPPYLNVAQERTSFQLAMQLFEIMQVLEPVWEKVSDTYYEVGAEAYAQARVFYKSVKAAAKAEVPGTDVIERELSKTFAKSKTKDPVLTPAPIKTTQAQVS
jgi:hypothetical protein